MAKKATKVKDKSLYDVKVKPYLEEIKHYVAHGITEKQLCEFYAVGRTAWAEYKKKYPELTDALTRARAIRKEELVNRAYQVALGYEYEEVSEVTYTDKNGNLVTKTYRHTKQAKPDVTMLQFLLINTYGKDGEDGFARDPQVIEIRKQLLELQKKLAAKDDGMEGV